ncbi:MAG: hypothetical protein RL187_259, partial [Actinomycetota bacterium]
MATYVWVGGHTGYTGTNSGFSAASQIWVDPRPAPYSTGATSALGDLYF